MPETDAPAAALAIERLRDAATSASEAAGLAVTFSCGVITFERPPTSLAAALVEVDRVLYARKRARRLAHLTCDPLAATLKLTRRVAGRVYAA